MAHPQDNPNENGCSFILGIITIVILLAVTVLLASCKTTDYRELYDHQSSVVATLQDSVTHYRSRIEALQTTLRDAERQYTASHQRDSVALHEYIYHRDSVATTQRGDTIYVDRWHWDYQRIESLRERMREDSLLHNHTIMQLQERISVLQDSLSELQHAETLATEALTHSTEVTTEKKPSIWQNLKAQLGDVLLFLCAIAFIIYILKRQKGGQS